MRSELLATLAVCSPEDLARLRREVLEVSRELGFGLVDQTRITTAASELGRNAMTHGGGGQAHLERLDDGPRHGLRLTFEDQGPGIADHEAALTDGFSTARGLGLGLGGARRLMDEMEIEAGSEQGIRISVTRWAI